MKLVLSELTTIHPALRGHPTDIARFGGLALQRAGHASPAPAEVELDGIKNTAEIEWRIQNSLLLEVLDANRITEEGAEAIALSFANIQGGWIVKRRLQRRESADWLLHGESGWLALEVSGTQGQDLLRRLREKKDQVAKCSLLATRLAVVVAFDTPTIAAGHP